jgi:hypothetical protein
MAYLIGAVVILAIVGWLVFCLLSPKDSNYP